VGVLTAALADVYRDRIADGASTGDAWEFLRGEEDEWRRIVRATDRGLRAARDAEGRAGTGGHSEPGAPAAPGASRVAAAVAASMPGPGATQPDVAAQPATGTPSRGEPSRRTTLLDADRKP